MDPDPSTAGGTSHGPDRPLTVGLLTANIHLGVGATLWSGACAAAERNDVNLICFPGGNLRHGDVARSELYELAGPARLDGVVCWSSTLGLPSGGPRTLRLLRRLAHLPLISLNQPLSDQTDVLSIDSHAGMRKLVEHLVVRHGRRKPACIHGPLDNPVSEERYRSCVDALRHHGIRSEHVGAAVDFASAAGASAMQVLLEARGLTPGVDFDVVLACSDVLAAGALRHLTERGIRVPEDVAVVGFNDSPEARLGDPPLTSVALPFEELGALAVDTLVARLRGTRPPDRTTIPATLVPRRSCGCPYPTSYRPSPVSPAPPAGRRPPPEGWNAVDGVLPSAAPRLAAAFRAALARAGDDRAHMNGTGGVGGAGGADAPAATTDDGVRPGDFLPLVEQLLRSSTSTQAEVDRWHQALESARRGVVDTLPGPLRRAGEALFGQARLVVAERSRALLEYERWSQTQRARRLREFGTALTTVVDLEGLSDVLERHLGRAGVPHCRIVLYDRAADTTGPAAAGVARPLLARAEADREAGPAGPLGSPAFSPALLLPDSLLPRGGRFTLVLEPLHIGEEHLGVAVFEATSTRAAYHDGTLYRELGDQLSAALKGIGLFDEVRRARDAAEQASRFQTRLLTHVTDELRTPVEAMLHHRGDPEDALMEVRRDAVRVLHLMENLLDLARSEAGDLLLTRRLVDPLPVLSRACAAAAAVLPAAPGWRVDLPGRLPSVWVDETRLRQILHNVLVSAAARAKEVPPRVAAALGPAGVRVTVTVPDARASFPRQGQLLDVGVTTARRLAMMHGGALTVSDSMGRAQYVLELPLPSPDGQAHLADAGDAPLLVVTPGRLGADVREHAARHGLEVVRTDAAHDPVPPAARRTPGAVVWDALPDRPQEWRAVQRLFDHPALRHTPFVLFGAEGDDLPRALRALRPDGFAEPVIVAGGSQESRETLRKLAETALPDHPVRVSTDATTLLALVADETPRLVLLERALPDLQALDVVDRLHDGTGRALCPVVIADHEGMTAADARRGRQHPALLMLDLDVFAPHEAVTLVRELAGHDSRLLPRTRDVLDEALVFLYGHWRRPISRWQVAQAAGVSPDHLGKLFQQRYGLTVWEYLTRLRIRRAAERLRSSNDSVQSVARAVGFRDRAYFSRVFRRVTGAAPHHYRERPPAGEAPRNTPPALSTPGSPRSPESLPSL